MAVHLCSPGTMELFMLHSIMLPNSAMGQPETNCKKTSEYIYRMNQKRIIHPRRIGLVYFRWDPDSKARTGVYYVFPNHQGLLASLRCLRPPQSRGFFSVVWCQKSLASGFSFCQSKSPGSDARKACPWTGRHQVVRGDHASDQAGETVVILIFTRGATATTQWSNYGIERQLCFAMEARISPSCRQWRFGCCFCANHFSHGVMVECIIWAPFAPVRSMRGWRLRWIPWNRHDQFGRKEGRTQSKYGMSMAFHLHSSLHSVVNRLLRSAEALSKVQCWKTVSNLQSPRGEECRMLIYPPRIISRRCRSLPPNRMSRETDFSYHLVWHQQMDTALSCLPGAGAVWAGLFT